MPKPQAFHVLRCYQCLVFQVHQAKKSNKFQCKLCGEKQSLKRRYGIGTAKDCRLHVQKLNGIRGELDELKDALGDISEDEDKLENVGDTTNVNSYSAPIKSKWSNYFDENEQVNKQDPKETMYLNNTEVVLEVPNKKKKRSFKCPTLKEPSVSSKYEHHDNSSGGLPDKVINKPVLNETINNSTKPKTYLNPNVTSLKKNEKSEPGTKNKASTSKGVTKEYSETSKPSLANSGFKKFVPPMPLVNSNSKWAHFVDDIEEPRTDDENETTDDRLISDQVSQDQMNLFALCDDNEIDDVLDF